MLHGDRWIEMDLIWFDPARPLDTQIDELLTRLAPLWRSTSGIHGLCFNVGWLIDLVTEWTGQSEQKLPLRSQRTAAWAACTYTHLRDFFARLREGAARHGLADLQIGVLFVGWAHVVWPPDIKIYDFQSDWYARHPELYGGPNTIIGMPDLWPVNRLHADQYPYAAFPNGLSADTYFPAYFAAQWGHLSRFLGINVLHLRDGMTGPLVYTRVGPFGASIPDDADWQAWTQAVTDLYRMIKTANPATFLIGYSSAISATAEWRVGGVDLEALVVDGAIDAWVDQTWGGAWQDWWHQLWKGWTFQLGNLLGHRAQIEAGNIKRLQNQPGASPCRHYNLIETWDGWEPWDTLHQVPDKLRWAMWAYSHASALTPRGLRKPDGSYISWANHRSGKLLSESDVHYLSTHLDQAQSSAEQLEHIYGPAAVYNRPALDWLMAHHPSWNASEWIEDQVSLLTKWGVPCLAITRTEWLPDLAEPPDGLIVQTPGQLDEATHRYLVNTSQPCLIIGRADVIDTHLLAKAGAAVQPTTDVQPGGFIHLTAQAEIAHLPPFQPVQADNVLLDSEAGPLATQHANTIYWQPPDWSEPGNAQLPKYQLGSTLPHAMVAQAFRRLLPAGLDEQSATWAQPVCCHLWRSAGRVYVLFGNLETGSLGDSRYPRSVALVLPATMATGNRLERIDKPGEPLIEAQALPGDRLAFALTVEPAGSAVYILV
ncbi:MAG: hypothetical protein IT324_01780 [Anaerolineae bacterium]|nr:hypothetical protein [Anaerolineae bacterium]